jgi:hypothetical protein
MGADIHGVWVMARIHPATATDGEWWDHIATVEGHRNYVVFSLLAGVRAKPGADQMVPTRGWPEESWKPWGGDHNEEDGWCHSASWATTDEVRAVRDRYQAIADEQQGYPTRSWLDLLLVVMEHIEEGEHPARAVFCFDN